MVKKKDLVIVALAAFCLTATLFTILPTKSNPGLGEYDPWIDNNEDGTIDIYDALGLGRVYGTSGDPTKNVHITNPTFDARSIYFNISWTNYTATWIWSYTPSGYGWTGGYSRLFIHLLINDMMPRPIGEINTTIYVKGILWNSTAVIASYETFGPESCNATIFHASQLQETYPESNSRFGVTEFKVKAETIEYICFKVTSLLSSGWISGTIVTYLRNE